MEQTIYDTLKSRGVDVYFPNQKTTPCTANYVVIRVGNQMGQGGNRVGGRYVDLMLYVPDTSFIAMFDFIEVIKDIMGGLPVMASGQETPIIKEPDLDAYSTSIEYVVLKKFQ